MVTPSQFTGLIAGTAKSMSALLRGSQRGDASLQEPSNRRGCGNSERVLETAAGRGRLVEASVDLAASCRQQVVARVRRLVYGAADTKGAESRTAPASFSSQPATSLDAASALLRAFFQARRGPR